MGLFERLLEKVYRRAWRFAPVHRRLLEKTRPKDRAAATTQHLLELQTGGRPAKFILTRPGHLEDALVEKGEYETYITSLIRFFMGPDSVFLDVGANIGLHALQIAGRFPDSRCFCFEPHPVILRELRRNVRLSGFGNVSVHPVACGDRKGEVEFHLHGEGAYNRGLSSLSKNPDMGEGFRTEKVQMIPLDEALEPGVRDRVRVVKIDTQGSELQVIRGMKEILARAKPVLIFEFESDYAKDPAAAVRETISLLPEHRLFKIRPGMPELEAFQSAEVERKGYWVNLIALPRESADF